jgi:hypothetical protein
MLRHVELGGFTPSDPTPQMRYRLDRLSAKQIGATPASVIARLGPPLTGIVFGTAGIFEQVSQYEEAMAEHLLRGQRRRITAAMGAEALRERISPE